MKLSQAILKQITASVTSVPADTVFTLPEKVLQFGTGVLLRGLPDYFIDKANKQGIFNGRIVVVKSTVQGSTEAFAQQDCLYTLCVRGIQDGKEVAENIISAAISRVLSAADEWQEVLQCAHNPAMQVIISNTTEVGIQLVEDDLHQHPPHSFPGKLLSFLYERFKAFGGSAGSGMIIIPTELIPDNGRLLEAIVLELARRHGLPAVFMQWLQESNRFCNSLVDRIVPGAPQEAQQAALEAELGYEDRLLTLSEVYRLWAIEGDEKVQDILSFATADAGVIIAPDINRYRELKLRLLNGTHTLSCGLAFLHGFQTVQQAMRAPGFSVFISQLMQQEIGCAIPYPVEYAEVLHFSSQVLDRFRNPHIRHLWINITLQYTSKMKMRCVPLLLEHYRKFGEVPNGMALGFAAYLAFTRPVREIGGKYFGRFNEEEYPIQDDQAPVFLNHWQHLTPDRLVHKVLADTTLWGCDLTVLPGFATAVTDQLQRLLEQGAAATLKIIVNSKAIP